MHDDDVIWPGLRHWRCGRTLHGPPAWQAAPYKTQSHPQRTGGDPVGEKQREVWVNRDTTHTDTTEIGQSPKWWPRESPSPPQPCEVRAADHCTTDLPVVLHKIHDHFVFLGIHNHREQNGIQGSISRHYMKRSQGTKHLVGLQECCSIWPIDLIPRSGVRTGILTPLVKELFDMCNNSPGPLTSEHAPVVASQTHSTDWFWERLSQRTARRVLLIQVTMEM